MHVRGLHDIKFMLPGIYERLVRSHEWEEVVKLQAEDRVLLEGVSETRRRQLLQDEVASRIPALLDAVASGGKDEAERARYELAVIAKVLRVLREEVAGVHSEAELPSDQFKILRAIHEPGRHLVLPRTGFQKSWLFTSAKSEPSLFAELRAELETAQTLDMVVSFIKRAGVRKLADVLDRVTAINASGQPRLRIRVLTTTYLGATDREAVDHLARYPGVRVRVSLDGRRDRLHAKAWMFERENGFGTAFIGSANLSKSALIDGIEWTLKIAQAREPDLFKSAQASFETLWNDPEFQAYDPSNPGHSEALARALEEQRQGVVGSPPMLRLWFDLAPKPFQQEMLDQLDHERRHGRRRNLVVAATGTGKTVVSAFDYQRLCRFEGGRPRLLFVAHQRRILQQAQGIFRQVLRDPNFGEILDGGSSPPNHDHLFAMIQTLVSRDAVNRFGADYWRMVIVDEAHHLPARTFDCFIRSISPHMLLGLTATPERADGRGLHEYFDSRPDGSPAVSLRLWDALNLQLLCPFEYYASGDQLDLRGVDWGQANELAQVAEIVSCSTLRAETVLRAIELYVDDLGGMRALAFCVSVDHARFMAARFNQAGLHASVLTGDDTHSQREEAVDSLRRGHIRILCTVNLFNEGVDIVELNTLLLLRPSQSPVLFQQQIGRGLRLDPSKSSCLILDFIGQYDSSFRFDILYRTLTGLSRNRLVQAAESGFGALPVGCHLQLDKIAQQRVLESLRESLRLNRPRLEGEIRAWATSQRGPLRLTRFLVDQRIEVSEVYLAKRSWNQLLRSAGLWAPGEGLRDGELLPATGGLIGNNDPRLLRAWMGWLEETSPATEPVVLMLAHQLLTRDAELVDVAGFREIVRQHPAVQDELMQLLGHIEVFTDLAGEPMTGAPSDWPLSLHGKYSRRQILAATGYNNCGRRRSHREGILVLNDSRMELLFVTLDKTNGFSEATRYQDYAVSPELFVWQTQNRANPGNASGRRYIESRESGWHFFLFVRETNEDPFVALGEVRLDRWDCPGNGPIEVRWRLCQPLSAGLFRRFSVLRDL